MGQIFAPSVAGAQLATKTVAPQGSGFVANYYTDGTADDVQIQQALDAVNALGGGLVWVRAGTYNFAATVAFAYGDVTLIGEGPATLFKLSDGANVSLFKMGDGTTLRSRAVFRDFRMDGNYANQTSASLYGIWLSKCNNCTFDNVVGDNFVTYAIYLQGASKYNQVNNCKFTTNQFDGIGVNDSYFDEISACLFIGNVHAGILLDNGAGNISITGNVADSNELVACNSSGAYVSITGNTIANTTNGSGISCLELSDSTIAGNTVYFARFNGLNMDGMRRCLVQGNVFANGGQQTTSTTAAIKIFRTTSTFESTDNIVRDNTCIDTQDTKTQDWGILELNGSDRNTYAGNFLSGNISGGMSTVGANNVIYGNPGSTTVLNAPWGGANASITSLTGLTTPLSAAQGGSGIANTNTLNHGAGGTLGSAAFTASSAYDVAGAAAAVAYSTLGIVPGQYGGTGVANTGFTITLAGNIVTTGAFNTTFAQAASTTVTLPSTSSTMARTDAAQTFTGNQTIAAGVLLSGTSGASYIQSTYQASAPGAPAASKTRIWVDATGRIAWARPDGFVGTLDTTAMTASRTYTFPDASITVARTDAAQTFTGTQTFGAITSTGITSSPISGSTGSFTTLAASGAVTMTAGTANSNNSTTTGTLVVTGGIGSSSNITAAGHIHAQTGIWISPSGYVQWTDGTTNRATMYSVADGKIQLTNNAANGFTILQFGVTTSSGAAFQTSGTAITAGLADGTAGGSFTASGTLAVTGASTLTGLLTANGGITMADATNFIVGSTTGTKWGTATSQKQSFWNAAPIIQPTRAGQLTDNSGGTDGAGTVGLIVAAGVLTSAASIASTANAVATIAARLNLLEAKLSAAGGGSGITA